MSRHLALSCLAPQATLAAGLLCALAAGTVKKIPLSALRAVGVVTLLMALSALGLLTPGAWGPMIKLDSLGLAWQYLFLLGALPAALLIGLNDELPIALILGSVLGMALLAVSDSLLLLFIGLELMSIPAYLLVAQARGSEARAGREAALKYFFAGGVASSLFLMGLVLHYAASGDLSLRAAPGTLGEAGQALMGAAALFKVGAVPLHFWLPDVYEGSAPEVAGFFSTAIKAAGVLLLMRIAALSPHSAFSTALPFLGALTALVGALLAARQAGLRRLLAYSSISHAGNLILGVGAWAAQDAPAAGAAPLFFYLAVYVFMSNGVFAFLKVSGLGTRAELAGYGKSHPGLAAVFTALLLSLAGIPPTGGFLAKLLIFWEAVKCGLYWPVAGAALSALIGLAYYLGLIQNMYFESEQTPAPAQAPGEVVIWACGLAAALLGLGPWLIAKITL